MRSKNGLAAQCDGDMHGEKKHDRVDELGRAARWNRVGHGSAGVGRKSGVTGERQGFGTKKGLSDFFTKLLSAATDLAPSVIGTSRTGRGWDGGWVVEQILQERWAAAPARRSRLPIDTPAARSTAPSIPPIVLPKVDGARMLADGHGPGLPSDLPFNCQSGECAASHSYGQLGGQLSVGDSAVGLPPFATTTHHLSLPLLALASSLLLIYNVQFNSRCRTQVTLLILTSSQLESMTYRMFHAFIVRKKTRPISASSFATRWRY
ncbi:hypothetical protein BDK51DRAFT_44953 [Blyttiomyces helicus]|uniref:Uncharacterized protein n=1 Tax=Blyttiomyces helicus TaxID=388810 RepID=A0A4P9WDA1_9FUNG|nr:hypothetical protein BDK51DRAFT_44953 [Blyttiomyces helicus]|eukprot:RKO90669.1 hypothetical protein BDK51DRAFT_44953 [Blyttiomyces helicus]